MLPLVKASYPARATSLPISFGETEKDGEIRYQIAVEFQIEVTDERPDLAEFSGETITWIGHFTADTEARTMEALQIAGWKGDDVSELEGVPGIEALPDLVSLACDVNTWDGKTSLRVNWVNRPRGHFAFKQAADSTGLKQLGARLRSTAKSLRAQGGMPRKAVAGGSGGGNRSRANSPNDRNDIPPPSDNDVPF